MEKSLLNAVGMILLVGFVISVLFSTGRRNAPDESPKDGLASLIVAFGVIAVICYLLWHRLNFGN